MQRWMLWAALAAVGVALLGGGALYGLKEYRANKPDKIWVPLPLRADLSMAEQKDLAEKIDVELRKDERLRKVVTDLGLVKKFNVADEDAAVKELESRLFVDVGSADTPNGQVPSINIGVRGISRENPLLREMASRIIKDVWVMIGIDPNTGKRLDGTGMSDAPGDL
ncbi:MAG: hypothetical protein NWT08_01920 [Akkermansiaceae bacterium]|jgi:hypothetical protein|nr:hypothetical protein [Akkermansiaceae bacterium]MDP4780593.1 hypothetical protein [Akkermansiaceae bacterium]MDP4847805.1 hypothetical protein [Akkermansiaceae bacterium]